MIRDLALGGWAGAVLLAVVGVMLAAATLAVVAAAVAVVTSGTVLACDYREVRHAGRG